MLPYALCEPDLAYDCECLQWVSLNFYPCLFCPSSILLDDDLPCDQQAGYFKTGHRLQPCWPPFSGGGGCLSLHQQNSRLLLLLSPGWVQGFPWLLHSSQQLPQLARLSNWHFTPLHLEGPWSWTCCDITAFPQGLGGQHYFSILEMATELALEFTGLVCRQTAFSHPSFQLSLSPRTNNVENCF